MLDNMSNKFRFIIYVFIIFSIFGCKKEIEKEQEACNDAETVIFKENVFCNDIPVKESVGTDSLFVVLPTVTDFSNIQICCESNNETMTANGMDLSSRCIEIDAEEPIEICWVEKDSLITKFLTVLNTGLPVVRINTPDEVEITSKEIWLEDAEVIIEKADGTIDFEGESSIKGRGNSTWGYPKKPYALKLEKKSEILGMPEHKRWILLANWKDRTLLRNDAAFWLSRHSKGLEYTVRGEFVELVLNGKHQGNYYLCEQISLDQNRVNGDYLMEVDTYFDEVNKFESPLFGLKYQFKQPNEKDLSDEAFEYFYDYISELEYILSDKKRVRKHEYEKYLDIDSVIDYILVNELVNNNDLYSTMPTPGPHSFYMSKDSGEKLKFGPIWDFDWHTFVPRYSRMWSGADKTPYYPSLFKDRKFKKEVLNRWEEEKYTFLELSSYLDEMAEKIRLSEEINQEMWPISKRGNEDELLTFPEAIEQMKKGFEEKWRWMDSHLKKL